MISKISKGSRMDQIYIPKNRTGFYIGSHVIIKPLEIKKTPEKFYSYNAESIEPAKIMLIEDIFRVIDSIISYENIIITGSFLDSGFNFRDIDILLISGEKINKNKIEKSIKNYVKIDNHIILFNKKTFFEALKIDPLWRLMLSRCISKYRLTPIPKRRINYKILDLHL